MHDPFRIVFTVLCSLIYKARGRPFSSRKELTKLPCSQYRWVPLILFWYQFLNVMKYVCDNPFAFHIPLLLCQMTYVCISYYLIPLHDPISQTKPKTVLLRAGKFWHYCVPGARTNSNSCQISLVEHVYIRFCLYLKGSYKSPVILSETEFRAVPSVRSTWNNSKTFEHVLFQTSNKHVSMPVKNVVFRPRQIIRSDFLICKV